MGEAPTMLNILYRIQEKIIQIKLEVMPEKTAENEGKHKYSILCKLQNGLIYGSWIWETAEKHLVQIGGSTKKLFTAYF